MQKIKRGEIGVVQTVRSIFHLFTQKLVKLHCWNTCIFSGFIDDYLIIFLYQVKGVFKACQNLKSKIKANYKSN